MGRGGDFAEGFLVLSFGFFGTPGYFCLIGDALLSVHRPTGSSSPDANGAYPYGEVYFADAMFREVRRAGGGLEMH